MSAYSSSFSSSMSEELTRSSSPDQMFGTKTNLGWIAPLKSGQGQTGYIDPQVHFTAGTMCWIYQQHAEAAKHFEKGIEWVLNHPEYPLIGHSIDTYHKRTAECYLALNKYKQAASHLKRYLISKMPPHDTASADKHILAAKCCLAIDDYVEAANHFKCALGFYDHHKQNKKSKINLTQLRIDTAHACLRAEEYATAASIFENIIGSLKAKKTSVPLAVFHSAALACLLNNEPEKAIAYFERYQKECRKKGLPVLEEHSDFFLRIDQK